MTAVGRSWSRRAWGRGFCRGVLAAAVSLAGVNAAFACDDESVAEASASPSYFDISEFNLFTTQDLSSLYDIPDIAIDSTYESLWDRPPVMACFDKDNPPTKEVMMMVNQAMVGVFSSRYNLTGRWSGASGTPRTLTWSFVPDGLSISSGVGEAVANSNLFSSMDTKFAALGGRATWIAQFQACFDRWAALTGTAYTRITVGGNDWDDGAAWGTAGAAGARGDCRISGKNIDGVNGVLAYNFFPSTGDMVVDTSENWASGSPSYIFLRNTLTHEHGHGIGLLHVCPSNGSKLMEPFLNTGFDGPRHDDLRAAERHYGDAYESNDTSATATALGALSLPGSLNPSTVPAPAVSNGSRTAISINGDVDFYSFSVASAATVTITVTPVGLTYLSGPQNADGSCSAGTNVNSLQQSDLAVELIGTNGTTVLASANATALGGTETITSFALPSTGTFFVRVFEVDAPSQSQLYTLSISGVAGGCTGASIASNPSPLTRCVGTSAAFSVTAAGTAPFTYQWRKNTANIVGATASTYTIASVVAGDVGSYDCVVTNSCGNATSTAAALTVNTAASVASNPSGLTRCTGTSATFSVTAGGTAPFTYQWRKNSSNISGATSSSFTIPSVAVGDSGSYDVIVTNSCGSATSTGAALVVNTTATITSNPAAQSVCVGNNALFSVGTTGAGPITYQWRKNTVNIPGATGVTYNIATVAAGDSGSYDVVVTNPCGNVTSTSALLTVNTAPGISAPPSNASACEGQPASFSVVASGTAPLTYQWRKNTINILGATSSTYNIAAVTAGDAGSYDVVVTNSCGNATSAAATLNVDTGPSTSNPSNQTLAAGGIANFSVTASGSGPLSYQWRKDTVNLTDGGDISGATTNSLSIANVDLADEGAYDVVVTNLCGSATSTAATLDVTGCPTDLDDGSGTGVPDGGTDVNDLLYFLACFEVGGPCADIDDDGQDPQSPDGGTDINDLLFFLAHFEAGC